MIMIGLTGWVGYALVYRLAHPIISPFNINYDNYPGSGRQVRHPGRLWRVRQLPAVLRLHVLHGHPGEGFAFRPRATVHLELTHKRRKSLQRIPLHACASSPYPGAEHHQGVRSGRPGRSDGHHPGPRAASHDGLPAGVPAASGQQPVVPELQVEARPLPHASSRKPDADQSVDPASARGLLGGDEVCAARFVAIASLQ